MFSNSYLGKIYMYHRSWNYFTLRNIGLGVIFKFEQLFFVSDPSTISVNFQV